MSDEAVEELGENLPVDPTGTIDLLEAVEAAAEILEGEPFPCARIA